MPMPLCRLTRCDLPHASNELFRRLNHCRVTKISRMTLVLLLLAASPLVPTATPAEVGLTQSQVDDALAEWKRRTGPTGIARTAIIRRGRLVHAGPDAGIASNLYSSTKSFTSTALGLLVEDGTVTLDTPAAKYVPVLRENYPGALLRHFTTMTSGYNAVGDSRWDRENSDWSWTPYAPARTPHFAPGTAYAYWDEAQMMLGRTLTIAAERDLLDLMTDRVLAPIGIERPKWQTEGTVEAGNATIDIRNGCTGLFLSAYELARYGQLFLQRGEWNGEQIIPADWVATATSVQVDIRTPVGDTDRAGVDGRGCYGFNWWVNGCRPNGSLFMPDVPEGAFFSAGLKHNVCLVVPAWDLVIVRLGVDHNPPDGHAAVLNDVAARLKPVAE